MWHRITKIEREPDGKIVAEIEFPPESKWFRGHFPGDPLVPAVAQLALLREALSRAMARPYTLTEMKRIKFRAMVRPGDSLTAEITPKANAPDWYGFRTFKGQDVAASGMVRCYPETDPGLKSTPDGDDK